LTLSSIFVGGLYIGNTDEVRKLYESDELYELRIVRADHTIAKSPKLIADMLFLPVMTDNETIGVKNFLTYRGLVLLDENKLNKK